MVRYAEYAERHHCCDDASVSPSPRMSQLLAIMLAALLGACREENNPVPPQTAEVGVAQPLQQAVTPYLEATGNAAAFNTVDLVARVEGVLNQIVYQDGATAKQGDLLFVIDPAEYQAKLQQAEAALASAQAQALQADAEYRRQAALVPDRIAAATTVDQARAQRDTARANIVSQQAGAALATLSLNYTRVTAPFEGMVTAHLVSVGSLVGVGGPTKLASLVQLDPIYVNFTISEQDVLRIRAQLAQRGLTTRDLGSIPVEAGLMTEDGYPHQGKLDYAAPQVDSASGTLAVRGVFANPDRALLPGYFLRLRVPLGQPQQALLVPDQVLGTDQGGRYALVVDRDDVVQQRRVQPGQLVGGLRVIEHGLAADDRVVVARIQRAVPGSKVVPQPASIAPATTSASLVRP